MKAKLVFISVVIVLLGGVLVFFRDLWTAQPWRTSDTYTNLFQAVMDAEGAVYTISDSKKTLRKVDASGKLVYSVSSSEREAAGTVRMFNDIAADEEGNAYALITILDSHGLQVYGEEIVAISPGGTRERVLYSVTYPLSDNLLRVGKIQSLAVAGDELYFFRKEENKAVLLKLPRQADGAVEPQTVAAIEAPEGTFLKEVAGRNPDRLFFTTQRGFLFVAGGRSVTPLPFDGGTSPLHFPVGIVTEDHNRLYYIDHHDAAVYRLDTTREPYAAKAVLTLNEVAIRVSDPSELEFTDVAITNDGLIIATTENLVFVDELGRIQSMVDSYRYPLHIVALRILYWLLIALEAVLIVLAIRHLYVQILKRRVNLLLKQLAAVFPIVLVSMIVLSYSVYTSFTHEMKETAYHQLELLATNGNLLVDGELLEKLNSPQDYMSGEYAAIKQRLRQVFEREDRDGLYNAVYRYMNGQLYLIMDDDDSITMFQPFPLSEENRRVLEHGEIVSNEWKDWTGEWLYAIGPIYNAEGEIVGIYESGKDLNGIHQRNVEILTELAKMFAISGVVLVAAISLMTYYLLSSINKLRRNVNLFASGEWDVHVDIRTRDEVRELGDRFNMMARSIRQYIQEMTRLSNAYFRFVPQQFLKVLGTTNMAQVQLGEHQSRPMTILVCYMRNFAEFSGKLTTEENFLFINSFLRTFGPVIREYGGFTSRYLGPGMLAMFPNDAGSALQAAMKLRVALEAYNAGRARSGYEPVEIGIAVHTGDVMLGIIGEEQRMEGSVVSPHVDLALDMERLSAKLGVSILITEATLQSAKTVPVHYRRLGAIQLDGDQPPVELVDVFEHDPPHIRNLKRATKAQFEAAVEAFRQGRFYDAREGFVDVVKRNRYDLAAKLYFFASDRYYQEGAPQSWSHALRIS